MNTTIDKLNGLKNTKQAIKQAIINKGVAVDEAATFASYANKIGEIQTGGGGEEGLLKIKTSKTWSHGSSWNQNCSIAINIIGFDWTKLNALKDEQKLTYLFYDWPGQAINLTGLDTEGVTNLSSMFSKCSSLYNIDVSGFNTKACKWIDYLFEGCTVLSAIKGLETWDTSNVQNMKNCFGSDSYLTDLNLSNWNTTNVTDITDCFYNCARLKTLNISSWNTDKVTSNDSNYSGFIYGCVELETVIWGNNWMSNPEVMLLNYAGSSYNAIAKLSHETILDLFNKLATRDNAPVLKLWNTVYDACTPEEIKIATDKGWTVTRVE